MSHTRFLSYSNHIYLKKIYQIKQNMLYNSDQTTFYISIILNLTIHQQCYYSPTNDLQLPLQYLLFSPHDFPRLFLFKYFQKRNRRGKKKNKKRRFKSNEINNNCKFLLQKRKSYVTYYFYVINQHCTSQIFKTPTFSKQDTNRRQCYYHNISTNLLVLLQTDSCFRTSRQSFQNKKFKIKFKTHTQIYIYIYLKEKKR
eukprot:TRINITY_DN371_c0_g1_i15.p2 TRINITY_DN371_c0_g1~~TRINITY_DN371_c0_g1_i15.p2  ORF type:complete len:199 (+),score=-15.12 TRINITY_DN371_c0_g1_i15:129-725(+)